ncbi:MAG: alkaline phosphatase family protein, partial [Bacteroidales bacterium]|nr:alkaline phosphatase family protein [Bacteroidales bacterium]
RSKSFVVAINAEDAIAMGGHAATGAVWLDEVHLRWGSTDYYSGGMPWQAAQMNSANEVKETADRNWQALFFPRTYLAALSEPNLKDFNYKPSDKQKGSGSASILKTTPMANTLVADLAAKLLKEHELGKDMHTDALLLQFTVRTPGGETSSLNSMEKEDMYLRLDNAVQELIANAETAAGAGNVLFVLYGSQTDTHTPADLQRFNFHAGYYNSFRSMALLNSYLMAIYGQEKWVKRYYGRHIYLNRELIEEKGHDFRKFQQLVADFVSEFEGVQNAWPLYQLLQLPVHPDTEMARLRNSVHRKTAGDVVILLKPGWLETDDQNRPVGESGSLNTRFPVYISGWKIAPQLIRESRKVTDIAPTLSGLLQLPAPNASIGKEIVIQLNE